MSAVQPAVAQRDWERVFFTGTATVMAAVVFNGFARTFFLPVPPLQFLIVPLLDVAILGTCVALAVIWRRYPQTHKRLMLMATVSMLTAAFARFPLEITFNNVLVAFILTDLFIVALAVWDVVSRGRLHQVTLLAGGVTIVSQPLRLALSESGAWFAFAGWLVGRPS